MKRKAKNDGNAQPAKRTVEYAALVKDIKAFGTNVKSVRETAEELMLRCHFHDLEYGNCTPFNNLLESASEAMNLNGIKAKCVDFFGLQWSKEKGAEGKLAHDKPVYDVLKADYAENKLAYAKKARAYPKFWIYAPNKPFEGLSLIAMLISAANKVEKNAKDPDKADKVKGASLVPALRAFIDTLNEKNDDGGDDGEPMVDDAVIATEIRDADAREAGLMLN